MYQSLLTPVLASSASPPEPPPFPAVSRTEPPVAELTMSYPAAGPRWVEVLVDCPGAQGLYTYAIPPTIALQAGDILSIPFGAQQVGAVALRLLTQPPPDLDEAAIRPVDDVVSRGFFPPTYWSWLQQIAQYYHTPLMQVVRVALPPGLLGRSQRRIRLREREEGGPVSLSPPAAQILALLQAQKQGDYSWHYLQRQVRGASRGLRELQQQGWVESYLEPPTTLRPKQRQAVTLTEGGVVDELPPRQRELIEILKRRGGELWLQELLQISQASSSVLKSLAQKGYVVIQSREVLRLEATAAPADRPKQLTPDQAKAVNALTQLEHFTPVLLHGVTGSGKTEVYLQTIAPLLAAGRSALVLVPEIGLTPQLTDRFRARFGDAVRVYHSALSDGERYDTWRQMLGGEPQVVIGTRSAVFAPLPNLSLIILDEEHDSSFKQDQPAPCYHARTLAHWRAAAVDCPLILGSATPSLETWTMAHPIEPLGSLPETDRPTSNSPHPVVDLPPIAAGSGSPAGYLSLPTRVADRPVPPIEIIDMRQELRQGNRSIFSRSLQTALRQMKAQGQQGILFIHRRGHSTFVSCRSCGHVMECPHCDVSLTYHQTQLGGHASLRCHYCGHHQAHPSHCPACSSPYLKHFGSGTQRVMQELTEQFPDLRCLRFDSDTTRAKGAHRTLLNQFAQGEADILVGTQMLTKGIDLPQVTLVGVVAADGLLHLSDFRASERAFQTLTQVAGRAGRGEEPGQVVIQTYSPLHPVLAAVQQQDYAAFTASELHFRQALHYPPYGQLISLRLSGMEEAIVQQAAETLATHLRSQLPEGCELLGPAPALIARVARRYRWQILIKFDRPAAIPNLIGLREQCPQGVSVTIDVDPLSLL